VAFSSGHRYWLANRSEAENRRLFGRYASPYGHGHNYVLQAWFRGPVEPVSGMVVNIKALDELMDQAIVSQFDRKSLNDEVPHFADRVPTLENLILYVADCLERGARETCGDIATKVELVKVKLEETPELSVELNRVNEGPVMTLTRLYEFAASHRLHNPALSEDRNLELYGKCSNPAGHGHNYKLEVTVAGKLDPESGMLVDVAEMDRIVGERVVERYDHKNLSEDVPELKGRVATSEEAALAIFRQLDGVLPARLVRIRLYETDRSCFEVMSGP
jgi:6-pyruvoyltetrahydropterin/6-carboxytetrahydropterin synthase